MNTTFDFDKKIHDLLRQLPKGRVITYGQLALLAGRPGWARRAGLALRRAPAGGLPCHRVVNSAGRLAPGWPQQRQLLGAEGVTFLESGRVNMKKHRIRPEEMDALCG